MERYFIISINGKKAMEIAREFCGGYCYRKIRTHGEVLAQLEPVLTGDDDADNWIDVSYIKTGKDVERTLSALAKIGFSGCPCVIAEETENGCFPEQNELCCMVI